MLIGGLLVTLKLNCLYHHIWILSLYLVYSEFHVSSTIFIRLFSLQTRLTVGIRGVASNTTTEQQPIEARVITGPMMDNEFLLNKRIPEDGARHANAYPNYPITGLLNYNKTCSVTYDTQVKGRHRMCQ